MIKSIIEKNKLKKYCLQQKLKGVLVEDVLKELQEDYGMTVVESELFLKRIFVQVHPKRKRNIRIISILGMFVGVVAIILGFNILSTPLSGSGPIILVTVGFVLVCVGGQRLLAIKRAV